MFVKVIGVLFATATTLYAACDNQCSGHGDCSIDDVCSCYDNWGVGMGHESGDCSDRVCPFELAWVDKPDSNGLTHRYSECAGKGICNRENGLCECFDGYEGKGCQRSTCPNDCSGHGTCEFVEDLPFGVVFNDYSIEDFESYAVTLSYTYWDRQKSRACRCDAQYADADCSKRMCPHGNDVLAIKEGLLANENHQVQTISFLEDTLALTSGTSTTKTFALTFTSKLNESYTTYPIRWDWATAGDFQNDIKLALLQLPNRIIDDCEVTVNAALAPEIQVLVTFTGDAVQGPQHLLEVEDYECAAGCTPKITGLPLEKKYTQSISQITTTTLSDKNSYECGRRGKCDYETGLCSCFEGYTGENCNTQTTLV